jgi:hypothetical protein
MLMLFLILILAGCTPINQMTLITPSETTTPSITQTLLAQLTPTSAASSTISPTETNTPSPLNPPPVGLIYRSSEGIWIVNQNGEKELMASNIPPDVDWVSLCSTGERFLLDSFIPESIEYREFSTIEISTGETTKLDPGKDHTFCYAEWWPNRCDTVLAAIQSWPEVGRYCEGSPTKITLDGKRSIIGESSSASDLYKPSADGKLLAYTRDHDPWIYQWGIGSQPINIKSGVFPFSNVGFIRPTWSPDNKKIAWLAWDKSGEAWNEGVAVYNLENKNTEFFYPNQVWSGEFPSYLDWNPKYDLIKLETPDGHISVLSSDGVERYALEHSLFSSWSPDGNWLTYRSAPKGIYNAIIVSSDGKESHELGRETIGMWSPDNKYLLFADGSGYSIEEVGKWMPMKIDLPEDARLIDWVNLEK